MTALERLRLALLVALGALVASVALGCAGARQADTAAEASPDDAREPAAEADHAHGAEYIERDVNTDHVPADVEFMRDMIVHHDQALEMSALVPDRTDSEDMRLLARRIEETQEYEIGLMADWLEERGLLVPGKVHGEWVGDNDEQGMDHSTMAGMATPEQMEALANAEGTAFDRMFLELMIRHHEGALVMVDELKEHEGAGQEPELFVLLSHVDADQRAEIARMRSLLSGL